MLKEFPEFILMKMFEKVSIQSQIWSSIVEEDIANGLYDAHLKDVQNIRVMDSDKMQKFKLKAHQKFQSQYQ